MINLLPPDYGSNIRYGRRNTALRRWIVGALAAIAGLAVILAAGSIYINQQSKSLNGDVADTTAQLKTQNLAGVQKDATEISGDIKTINLVLNQEINFSELIQDIGKTMPSGTVLSGLTLSKVDGAIDLSANATDYNSATQIAVNLSDPKNNIFNRVDIININCASSTDTYKCTVSLKALFDKDTRSHFLSVAKGDQ